MKKLFLYDDENFELLTCLLMGIDQKGSPQMIVTTPGMPVESLQEHQEGYLYADSYFTYLGEEGDTVPAKEIIRLFTGYLLMSSFKHDDLAELIKTLKLVGLKWSDDFQKLTFEVSRRLNDEGEVVMSLYAYLNVDGQIYMAHNYKYMTLRDVLSRIRQIMSDLIHTAGIPAACDLCISKDLEKDLSADDRKFFDIICIEDY